MKNPRITPKDKALLIAAMRRVYGRSEFKRKIMTSFRIQHIDNTRPRVKKWTVCASCKTPTPEYLVQLDHKIPVIPLNISGADMSLDDIVDRMWCESSNLEPLCKLDHQKKTKEENKLRRKYKKERKI